MNRLKLKVKDCCFSILAPITIALYQILFLALNNVEEISLKDIGMPMGISVLIVLCFMVFFCVFLKDPYISGLLSALFYALALNFGLLEKLIHSAFYEIRYWHSMPVAIAVFCAAAFWIAKKMDRQLASSICRIISLVFALLILLNVVLNMGSIVSRLSRRSSVSDSVIETEVVAGQPNVYYIILDEYSNFDVLEKYYNENNQEFHDFLVNRGFTVSEHSQNGGFQSTLTITTNYLNMDYVVTENDSAKANGLRNNPPLFQQFSDHGYNVLFHSKAPAISWNGSNGGTDQEQAVATTVEGKNFTQIFFENNIFYPFTSSVNDLGDRQTWYDAYNFLTEHIVEGGQSQFLYVHTVGAHQPFVFAEDGGAVPPSERTNMIDPQYYLGQYRFVTKQIMEAVDQILRKDPDSVIILMCDHSNRYTKDKNGNTIVSLEDKATILNAVYFRGERIEEINNQSGVNTLRIILNRLFQTGLEMIEVPGK